MKNLIAYNLLLTLITLSACVSSSSSSRPVQTRSSKVPVSEVTEFPPELQNLRAQWGLVKDRYDKLPATQEKSNTGNGLARSSISYILDDVQKAFKEQSKAEALKRVPNSKENLNLAESLLADLESGKPPFQNRKGDMHLAYRSEVDNSLQPFRLYIPESLDLSRQHPLVVGLHGRSGDENTIMDAYGDRQSSNNVVKQRVRQYGFIMVTPKGREANLGYQNAAEEDVIDVTRIVMSLYPVREDKVFLTGHSMGGGGTMLIGLKHPDLYKALAPIAGGLWVAGGMNDLSAKAASMPVRFYHGADDKVVPADPNALESSKKKLKNFEFKEYPGEDHSSIFFRAIPEVFAFFVAI